MYEGSGVKTVDLKLTETNNTHIREAVAVIMANERTILTEM
jgi:hypothetical protein